MQSSPRKQSRTTTTPRRRPLIAAMLVIAAFALLGRPVPGFADLLFTNYTGEVTTTANASDTIGTEFTVGPQDLLVLRLGVYDAAGDGLSFAHQIGVWRVSDQNLLTSVTVPSGTGAALVEDWRFVALAASVFLSAGTTYRIGALESSPSDGNPRTGSFLTDAGIAAVTAGSVFIQGSFAYPDQTNDLVRLFANADVAAVPEPATCLLLATGCFGLLGSGWRRRAHGRRELLTRFPSVTSGSSFRRVRQMTSH